MGRSGALTQEQPTHGLLGQFVDRSPFDFGPGFEPRDLLARTLRFLSGVRIRHYPPPASKCAIAVGTTITTMSDGLRNSSLKPLLEHDPH